MSVREELAALASKRGILTPQKVVAFARGHPDSALHGRFDWDIKRAARKYWIVQAQALIRYEFTVIRGEEVRKFVSLTVDRAKDEHVYRDIDTVLSDERKKELLLADALEELEAFQRKYAALRVLTGVMKAIKQLVKKTSRRSKRQEDRVS